MSLDRNGAHVHRLQAAAAGYGQAGGGIDRLERSWQRAGTGIDIRIDDEIDALFLRVTAFGLVVEDLDHFTQRQVFPGTDFVQADAVELGGDGLAAFAGENQVGAGIGIGLRQQFALRRGGPGLLDFDQALTGSDSRACSGLPCSGASRIRFR